MVGVHTPVHALETHAEDTHVTSAPHVPFAVQVCTPLFEHCLSPGAHTPVQTPDTHALFEQGVWSTQVPFTSHDCGV